MASEVEICNRALQKIGAQPITALTDNSVAARACNLAFNPCKLALLERHFWNFSIMRAQLAASATPPDWGRANSFPLPSDFIKLAPQYPEDNDPHTDWQIEARNIISDDGAPIYIRYVKNVTDPNEMTPLFREALSTEIAYEIVEQITQSNTKKAALAVDRKNIIEDAKMSNAIQNVAGQMPEDEWILTRV